MEASVEVLGVERLDPEAVEAGLAAGAEAAGPQLGRPEDHSWEGLAEAQLSWEALWAIQLA